MADNSAKFEFVAATQWPDIWKATELVSHTVNLGDGPQVKKLRRHRSEMSAEKR